MVWTVGSLSKVAEAAGVPGAKYHEFEETSESTISVSRGDGCGQDLRARLSPISAPGDRVTTREFLEHLRLKDRRLPRRDAGQEAGI